MNDGMKYTHFFQQYLSHLKDEGRYRIFIDLERPVGRAPRALWHHHTGVREVVVWCSNDYMGMSHHPEVIEAMVQGAKAYGVGSGGTRNISGTTHPHVNLEQEIAKFHGKEAGLLFSSGYVANEAAISALGSHLPECVIFSDASNHASIIQGIRNSRAEKHVFAHNDLKDLEAKLKKVPLSRPKLIVFTSVYSMDGDVAPLKALCDLAQTYGCLTYVDEVHAVGMYGERGSGVSEQENVQHRLDVIQGNFAKGFGVVGGYITGNSLLVDFVRSTASGFIFTTSMPPAVALAIRASLNIIEHDKGLRKKFWQNVTYFKQQISKTFLPYRVTDTHIVPVIIGDATLCKKICDDLLRYHGIYIQPINYPTVPVGQERLRITITPHHTFQDIDHLLESLIQVCDTYGRYPRQVA